MPPKKGTADIRSFFHRKSDDPGGSSSTSTETPQTHGATASQTVSGCGGRVKEESCDDSVIEHSHGFTVRFGHKSQEYIIDCCQPCTVLEAIKSNQTYKETIKCADENILIQLGKDDKQFIIATHFPCTCIEDGASLIISERSKMIERKRDQPHREVCPKERYSVFSIDTEGGQNTKTKTLFRNNAVKQYKYLLVYGEKWMTVKEALKRDGRFTDDLDDFTLSHNKNPSFITCCTQKVNKLHQEEFKICLKTIQTNKKETGQTRQKSPGVSHDSQPGRETRPEADVLKQSGISVKGAVEKTGSTNTEEIYKILVQKFPELKKWMEDRFSPKSFQEELTLKKETFGKIQQSFSEIHRVKKLLKLGESVCKIIVRDVCEGTGFVLFDNFILTSAHLFIDHVTDEKLLLLDVFALFNYEDPLPDTNYYRFSCEKTLIAFDKVLDYAVLQLKPNSQKPNNTDDETRVPPGLLEKFGPVPQDGEACIIGHPSGGVKKMDPICIIEKKKRQQAVIDHVQRYKDTLFIVLSVSEVIKRRGIENILMGGKDAEKVVTYNTFMYHGSSGAPVFDACGQIIGLHTGGYTYGFQEHEESVIEFARPLLLIFRKFVSDLEKRNEQLLERVRKIAAKNQYLQEILSKTDLEPMEVD